MTIPRRFPEYAFGVYGMLLLSRAVIPVIEGTQQEGRSTTEQSILFTLLLAIFYVGVVGLLYQRRRLATAWNPLRRTPWLTLVLATLAASVLWSVEPAFTARRVLALLGTTVFGLYLAICLKPRQVLTMLVWSTIVGALLSLGFAALNPDAGIHYERGGGLRGVYQHQNTFGVAMALGFSGALALVIQEGRFRLFTLVTAPGLLAMVLLSRSATGILIVGLLALLFPLFLVVRRQALSRGLLAIVGLLVLTVGPLAGALYAEPILFAVGRDLTLTGRTALWSALYQMINETRPWLGYGYGAFWYNNATVASLYQFPGLGWGPRHAHSGWFEAVLDMGYVGTAVFGMMILSASSRAVREAIRDRSNAWPLLVLMMLLLADVQNSVILDHAVFWAMLVYLIVHPTLARESAVRTTTDARVDLGLGSFGAAGPRGPVDAGNTPLRR